MTNPASPFPTDTRQRIDLLDIFRGFALFGIFVVNIEIMNCTFMNQDAFSGQWTSNVDRIAVRMLQLFFYSKFFPIFSFLFGLGISMQALKSLANKTIHLAFFARRMAGLFIIGILHILLLWSGDVIHLYALLGLFTAQLLKKSDALLLTWAIILLLFPFYDKLSQLIFEQIGFDPGSSLAGYSSQKIISIIRTGSYLEGIQLRMLEYVANIPVLFVFLAPVALSIFLLGLYFGKNKFIYSIHQLVDRIKNL